jgi:hypothetical protein
MPVSRNLALISIAAVIACRGNDIVRGVSDSTFVQTMADLRRLPTVIQGDTSFRVRMRDSILRVHGVTAPQIESAAARLANDPERAAELWNAIEQAALRGKG